MAAGERKREARLGWLIQGKGEWPRERGEMEGSLSLRWWFLLFLSLDQLGEESGRCYESWFCVICGLKGGRRQLWFLVLGREPRGRKLWFFQREGRLTPFSRVVAAGEKGFRLFFRVLFSLSTVPPRNFLPVNQFFSLFVTL